MSAVQEMFDTIAPTYDTLNRVLSLGIDQSWRRRAVKMLGDVRGELVLDACAGRGNKTSALATMVTRTVAHATREGGAPSRTTERPDSARLVCPRPTATRA